MTEIDELVAVLAEAGPAHHTAYIESDGYDPEWPIWYANHVADDVRRILHRPELTVSLLVWAFVDADHSHRREAPDTPWPGFYAGRFLEQL